MSLANVILGKVKSWLRNIRLSNHTLRLATELDVEFIDRLIVEGIREGHFSSALLLPDPSTYKTRLADAIVTGLTIVEWYPERRAVGALPSTILIYCAKHAEQVGFAYLTHGGRATDDEHRTEFLMAAICPQYRLAGHGSRLVHLTCKDFGGDGLVARCLLPSKDMATMLKKEGFIIRNVSEAGTQLLARP